MLRYHYFLLILIIHLSPNSAEQPMYYYNNEENTNEENTCEKKLSAALSDMNIQSNFRLDALEKKIMEKFDEMPKIQLDALEKKLPERLEKYMDINFVLLEKKYVASQEDIRNKINKMRSDLLENLEEYIDEKINSLERHIYRKIDGLDNILADKTDASIIKHKLDDLKQMKIYSGNGAADTLANKTLVKMEGNMNRMIIAMEKTLSEIENVTTNFDIQNKNTIPKDNFDHKWTELKELLPKLIKDENIKCKLDTLEVQALEQFRENVTTKLDAIEEKIICADDKLKNNNTLDTQPQLNITDKLEEKHHDSEIAFFTEYLGCLEYQPEGHPVFIGINFKIPWNAITFYTEAINGQRNTLSFDMPLAIKGKAVHIMFAPGENPVEGEKGNFELAIYSDNIKWYFLGQQAGSIDVPDMMNTKRFTSIYIKIKNERFEMGKLGGPPLMTYINGNLLYSQRFAFATDTESTILYDCKIKN